MSWTRKSLISILLLSLAIVLARGWIYRSLISYSKIGDREIIELTNPELIETIKSEVKAGRLELLGISKLASKLTSSTLTFSNVQKSQDPNRIIDDGQANCIGYSAFFAAIAEYIVREQGESGKYEVKHLRGKLKLLGIDLHQFFKSPFFKDHDFNEIKNIETGEVIYVDPSMEDYLKVHRVRNK